jgi:hypothetical protein
MTFSVKHAFHSTKSDGADPTLVQPSNWNDEHQLSTAASKVLGSDASAPTTVQELPLACDAVATGNWSTPLATGYFKGAVGTTAQQPGQAGQPASAAGQRRFNTDTKREEFYDGTAWQNVASEAYVNSAVPSADLLPRSGDFLLTLSSAARTGWVQVDDGTLGNAGSGATTRANADCASLFAVLWAMPDAICPVLPGGRGVDAATDFAANKTIGLTKMLGRALAVAGTGAGLSARALGSAVGAEGVSFNGNTGGQGSEVGAGGSGNAAPPNHTHPFSFNIGIMQPTTFLNAFLKL